MPDAFAPVDGEIARAVLEAIEPYQAAPGIDGVNWRRLRILQTSL